ncbi:RNA polymerase sigma-70 factor [Sunxiuqinia sp. A32]|uniref:RNA polymerase sigma-70 factor n=1 Tax=Sunxiuqinia sp. A32 TaxID=3461496 RepID=UPI004045F36E
MNSINEKEILVKLAKGDQFSFGLVFNIYFQRLYLFANQYLNDEESSKDVVQDVFSIIWKDKSKLAEVNNLSSWLYTLTKNQCLKKLDHLKVKQLHGDNLKYRTLTVLQSSLNDLETSPLIFDEINTIINQTLEKLPPQSRLVFELSRFENKKNREIADELNISLKAVEAHITRSLKVFRKALKNYLPLVLFLLR